MKKQILSSLLIALPLLGFTQILSTNPPFPTQTDVITITYGATSGNGDLTGSLTPGKKADLVVLDKNIYDIPPDEIAGTQTLMTIFNGEIVFQASDFQVSESWDADKAR